MCLASLLGQNTKNIKKTVLVCTTYKKLGNFFWVGVGELFASGATKIFWVIYFCSGGTIFWGYANFYPEALVRQVRKLTTRKISGICFMKTRRTTYPRFEINDHGITITAKNERKYKISLLKELIKWLEYTIEQSWNTIYNNIRTQNHLDTSDRCLWKFWIDHLNIPNWFKAFELIS